VRIYVGTSPERVTEAARALQGGLLVGVPTVVAALAAVTSLLVGRSLRPVERIRAEVAEISTGEPARRVPVPATGDEIQRLGDTMNQMLERLADGHRREREFVGDVSHELLSPLASLRTQLEVAAATPDTTEWPELVRDLGDEVLGMERLVQDLLFLAREDAGAAPVPIDLVDLDDLVLQEVRRLRPPAGITVDTSDVSAAPVRGVPDDLGRLVRNLLENAAKHARSRVTAGLRLADGRAVLTVADDGPGIPSDLRERVFERFVRGGSARERRDGAGAGLGLPIARAIAVRHGGTLEPDETASGTRMRASLPAG
jgi:signal transduction histidine kinase